MGDRLQPVLRKAQSPEELDRTVRRWRFFGKKIAFTNGVFDILHRGHVTYLAQAAGIADVLIVGINSDESVKRLKKGPERPLNSQEDRAIVLAALGFVDAVCVFEEDTPALLIDRIKPDVLVKGGDYDADETDSNSPKYVVGSDTVKAQGGEVVTIPLVEGHSTSNIVKRMKGSQDG